GAEIVGDDGADKIDLRLGIALQSADRCSWEVRVHGWQTFIIEGLSEGTGYRVQVYRVQVYRVQVGRRATSEAPRRPIVGGPTAACDPFLRARGRRWPCQTTPSPGSAVRH